MLPASRDPGHTANQGRPRRHRTNTSVSNVVLPAAAHHSGTSPAPIQQHYDRFDKSPPGGGRDPQQAVPQQQLFRFLQRGFLILRLRHALACRRLYVGCAKKHARHWQSKRHMDKRSLAESSSLARFSVSDYCCTMRAVQSRCGSSGTQQCLVQYCAKTSPSLFMVSNVRRNVVQSRVSPNMRL